MCAVMYMIIYFLRENPIADVKYFYPFVGACRNNFFDSGVDKNSLTEPTWLCAISEIAVALGSRILIIFGVGRKADEVQSRAHGIVSRCMDNRIHFGMYRPAKFISFPGGDVSLLPRTKTQVHAVFCPSRSACIARADDLVILHNYGTNVSSQACPSFCDLRGYVQVIVIFAYSVCHFVAETNSIFSPYLKNHFLPSGRVSKTGRFSFHSRFSHSARVVLRDSLVFASRAILFWMHFILHASSPQAGQRKVSSCAYCLIIMSVSVTGLYRRPNPSLSFYLV